MTDKTQTQTQNQIPKASDDALALVSKSVESLQGVVEVIKSGGELTDEVRKNVSAVVEALTIVAKLDMGTEDVAVAETSGSETSAEDTPGEGEEQVQKNAGFSWPMDMNDLASHEA